MPDKVGQIVYDSNLMKLQLKLCNKQPFFLLLPSEKHLIHLINKNH